MEPHEAVFTATVSGEGADIYWGYLLAASLGEWELSAGNVLRATILDADELRIQQSGLTFVILRPSGVRLTWPILGLEVTGGTLHARLGRKEKVH